MSSSMLMMMGTRAMFAAYAQLQTAGNNIANANTPGYSRQSVQLGTSEGQSTGAGYFGRGVTVQSVTRASNMFLTQQVASSTATAQADATHLTLVKQLERVFGIGATGFGNAATQLFNAYSDLAAQPGDASARQAVIARAEDVASLARADADQIDALQANVTSDVKHSVGEINTLAAQVAALNVRIAAATASGQSPNDLLDSRDQLIQRISQHIEVHTIGASDGSMSVFIAGGQNLVLGADANKLVAQPDAYDPSRIGVAVQVAGQAAPLDTSSLGGGSLSGLLRFQDGELTDARNRLGRMVSSLATAMNQQQSFGIDLSGAAGAPLFNIGKPTALPASSNHKTGGAFDATAAVTVTDGAALKASEYVLDNDPASPGQFRLTRLDDGVQFTGLVDGAVVDGFSFSFGGTTPGAADRFLIKPSSNAAGNLSVAISNPRAIAAACPLTATTSSANTGSAAVASLAIVAAPSSAYSALTLKFNDAAGHYDLLDSGSVVASGTWTPGTPVSYNGFALSLDGVPAAGDSFTVAPTINPTGNNGNALAFDSMASRLLVDGQTVTDDYAETLATLGSQVQGAQAAADTSQDVAARAQDALSGEVGVNLDEEAAKLIQYQQAYQAAAKMLQTAQTMMDTLLQLGH